MELVLTGLPISAAEAYGMGLLNRIVPRAEVLGAALALADEIAKNAPLAVQESRDLVALAFSRPEAELWRAGFEASNRMLATDDVKEGVRAFLEKRPPKWRGR
jgi:enoyl-CoA hydratase/carnithine racemase